MHPGPMNRGVEIDSAVADGVQSVIREQVEMGVAVRMAVLDALARNLPARATPDAGDPRIRGAHGPQGVSSTRASSIRRKRS